MDDIKKWQEEFRAYIGGLLLLREDYRGIMEYIDEVPTIEPEISRIEQELHGKTPEEQYEFLYWLLLKFGLTYTDSRLAVIEWLR